MWLSISNDTNQSGFPRAIKTKNTDTTTLRKRYRHIVENDLDTCLCAIALGDIVQANHDAVPAMTEIKEMGITALP